MLLIQERLVVLNATALQCGVKFAEVYCMTGFNHLFCQCRCWATLNPVYRQMLVHVHPLPTALQCQGHNEGYNQI